MDLDAAIARYGVALQSVLTSHPYDPPFTYSIGRHLDGEPELIVVGAPQEVAGPVLNELARTHPATRVRAGAVVALDCLHGARVRLQVARPEWAADYALRAFDHAGAPPWDVPVLQVVLPNDADVLPGEAARPSQCGCCPDLSHPERPFPLPLDSTALFDVFDGPSVRPPTAIEVCVPVWIDDVEVGRVERLVADDLGDGQVRLLQPPVVADWTTAGAVLALDPALDRCGDPVASVELASSPKVHLTWAWSLLDLHQADVTARLDDMVNRMLGLPGVEITPDPRWLAVAAPSRSSHQVRAAARRLVRDGLLREADPFSRPGRCIDPRCGTC